MPSLLTAHGSRQAASSCFTIGGTERIERTQLFARTAMESMSFTFALLCVAGSVHVAAPVPKGPDDAGAGRSLSREHILCIEKTFYIVKPSPSAWAPRFVRRMSLRGGADAPPRIGVLGSPPPDDFEDARKYYGAEHIGDHLSTESEPGASACVRLSP